MDAPHWAPNARITDALNVDDLEPNAHHRMVVTLAEDALGRPIRVPLLIARGARPGPVFGMTAALHGNELNGIPVLHRVFQDLQPERLKGTVVGVVVANVPGYLMHQREFSDGSDLNHLFPGKPMGNLAELWAHRLLHRIVRRFDYLVDLHTASFGRVNCLYVRADMSRQATARMARLVNPDILLHNPPSDRTLRGAADEFGIPAITLEIGNPHRFQERYIKRARSGVRTLLGEFGLLPKRKLPDSPPPVLCRSSSWIYTDRGGLLRVLPEVTDALEAGQVIARQTNVFGDLVREYLAPEAGVVIGKSVDPVGQSGARVLHLGVPAAAGEFLAGI